MRSRECALYAVSRSSKVISRSTGAWSRRMYLAARKYAWASMHEIYIRFRSLAPISALSSIVSLTSILRSRHHNDIIDWMPFQTAPELFGDLNGWRGSEKKYGTGSTSCLFCYIWDTLVIFYDAHISRVIQWKEAENHKLTHRYMQSTFHREKLIGYGYKNDDDECKLEYSTLTL